jgi:hypothetical protein
MLEFRERISVVVRDIALYMQAVGVRTPVISLIHLKCGISSPLAIFDQKKKEIK